MVMRNTRVNIEEVEPNNNASMPARMLASLSFDSHITEYFLTPVKEDSQVTRPSGRRRIEHDLLRERAVPGEVYYGIQTLRALENFPINGVPLSHYPELVKALAIVKLAAA
jgi:hypothetical protein